MYSSYTVKFNITVSQTGQYTKDMQVNISYYLWSKTLSDWLIDWAGFNVSTNTVSVIIWETVLQVKRPNQQCQSTEGKSLQK